MALSPREEKVLATIEDRIRVEDPQLTAALSRSPAPSAATFSFSRSSRPVLRLLAALIVLIVAVALFEEQLGAAGVAVLTVVAIVPWMAGTARSAGRRSPRPDGTERRAGTRHAQERGEEGHVERQPAGRWWPLAVVPIIVAAALMPPAWQGAAALVVMLVVAPLLPWLVLHIVKGAEKRKATREKRRRFDDPTSDPTSPGRRKSKRGGQRVPERGPDSGSPFRIDCRRRQGQDGLGCR